MSDSSQRFGAVIAAIAANARDPNRVEMDERAEPAEHQASHRK